jgi:hypothetical protein
VRSFHIDCLTTADPLPHCEHPGADQLSQVERDSGPLLWDIGVQPMTAVVRWRLIGRSTLRSSRHLAVTQAERCVSLCVWALDVDVDLGEIGRLSVSRWSRSLERCGSSTPIGPPVCGLVA